MNSRALVRSDQFPYRFSVEDIYLPSICDDTNDCPISEMRKLIVILCIFFLVNFIVELVFGSMSDIGNTFGTVHPQINGKIEKWFDTYKRFRKEFSSLDEFIDWYNNCPHGSLDFESLESPELAFWRRLPQEAILRLGFRTFGWGVDETFKLS